MLHLSKRSDFVRSSQRALPFALGACVALTLTGGSLFAAAPTPLNLGNGLDRLVATQAVSMEPALAGHAKARISTQTFASENGRTYTTAQSAALDNLAIQDDTGRLLVRVYGTGTMPFGRVRKNIKSSLVTFTPTAIDAQYKGMGVMNAYVALEEVVALASTPGVRSVVLELKPRHNRVSPASEMSKAIATASAAAAAPEATPGQVYPNLGTYFDQGVIQHRVDAVSKFYNAGSTRDLQGAGLAIACISNSYAANAAHPATLDVTNGDLPGAANNPAGNTTPVFVYQDDLSSATSDDEGRGMCQIVYHMAPKAAVGFATADSGEVGFANNIRGLAGLPNFTLPGQTYAADVICDDVGYFDEPFYEDGIIGAGIEDAAAAGVSYFSSAANDIGTNGYESVIRLVPPGTGLTAAAGNTSLANTNINLAGVPPALYAGGFHNFNPNGLDVAQLVNVAANNSTVTTLQWNDPYDQNGGVTPGSQIYASGGTYTTAPVVFNGSSTPPLPPFTAGQAYQIVEAATNNSGFDAIVTVIAPDGSTVLTQDTGADETVNFTAPQTGQYQISVNHFGTTTGSFSLTVSTATITQLVTSDWNLLAFRTDTGAYVAASSLTTNNVASNQPIEIGYVNRTSTTVRSIQYVLARANTPAGPRVADHIRYLLPGNGATGYGPAEYFTYNTVTTGGHATSPSCNGTAAYPAFRPSIPESFTSPGPATIYFDKNSQPLATPEIRLQPRVAACDGANISANEGLAGLGSDDTRDYDAAANFYGTSAAAPHAAACALLVLESKGGRRKVTPAQMTSLLQRSAFPHDLDPNAVSGTAKSGASKLSLTIISDNESSAGTGSNDANSFTVAYNGPGNLTSLVFNPQGTAATGGNTTGGNNGLDATNTYTNNVFPGVVFPATPGLAVGSGSVGLVAADVTATTSNTAPLPSTTQGWTLTLGFPNSNFTGGKVLHFKVNRSEQHSSIVPSGTTLADYSADIFGGSVLIPEGTGTGVGMTFTATTSTGVTLTGTLNNRIGAGYSVLDGYGFINVESAVGLPIQ